MPLALCTLSHSPLMGVNQPPADVVTAVDGALADARAFIADFAPDLVLILAPDHYNGFFYDLMPPFCLGMAAEALGDYGTQAGALPVDRDAARTIAGCVLDDGVDLAISERMWVDHGFAQPLEKLLGGIDAMPVVPVFINSVAVPLGPVSRCRLLGESLGRAASSLGRRVLIIGSGGLSHDPPVPRLEGASDEVRRRLIDGRAPTAAARRARQEKVIAAGRALAAGTADIAPLNPDWDREVMRLLADGHLETIDGWTPGRFAREAGNSAHEVRTWIAAYAALRAVGPYRVTTSFYRPIPEWIAGFGVTTAR